MRIATAMVTTRPDIAGDSRSRVADWLRRCRTEEARMETELRQTAPDDPESWSIALSIFLSPRTRTICHAKNTRLPAYSSTVACFRWLHRPECVPADAGGGFDRPGGASHEFGVANG